MQAAVQSLANYWNARDRAIGFGVGIAWDLRPSERSAGTDASTTRRSETSSIWHRGFAIWRKARGPLPHLGCQLQPADVRPLKQDLADSRRSLLRQMPAK